MKVQHYFWSTASAPVPARWQEAFADGRALGSLNLLARLRGQAPERSMVWLSADDAQWSAALQQLLQTQPGARVVLLSGAPEPQQGLLALNAGARAYTHAYAVPSLLQEVATVVAHGGLWVGPELLLRLVGSAHTALAGRSLPAAPVVPVPATPATANPWQLLSAREAQVARAVSAGCSNKEVANLMFISERTVKAHLGAVFEKLGLRDRLQLVLHLASFPDPQVPPASEASP